MTDETFDQGDLYGLEVCLRDMDEMIARAHEAKTDKAVAYAQIKTFELTYELSITTLRKYLLAKTGKTDQALTYDLADFIRLADQFGLLKKRLAGVEGVPHGPRAHGPYLQRICRPLHLRPPAGLLGRGPLPLRQSQATIGGETWLKRTSSISTPSLCRSYKAFSSVTFQTAQSSSSDRGLAENLADDPTSTWQSAAESLFVAQSWLISKKTSQNQICRYWWTFLRSVPSTQVFSAVSNTTSSQFHPRVTNVTDSIRGNFTLDSNDDLTPFDKLREECGVMAVYNHPDAARLTYWGLVRPSASAGRSPPASRRPMVNNVNDIKGMGLVSEIFKDDVLRQTLPGYMAIGHSRYSDHRRFRAAQRPAHLGRIHQGPHRHRPQRQPHQPRQRPRSSP